MKTIELTTVDNTDKFVVTQSNELIEANYFNNITTRAHKVARLILALINPNDSPNNTGYTVTVKALQQYLGMNKKTKWGDFYREIKDIYEELKQTIEIRKPDGGKILSPLVIIETTPKKGVVTFHIPPPLLPYLIELKKNYTSYLLINIPKLRSGYSVRLYELLYQYRKIGKRYFLVDELQEKVGSSYKLYGDFKRNVIAKAQKDIKKNTDINFAFHEKKQGRKVIGIQFIIFGNKPKQNDPNQLSFLKDAIDVQDNREKPALSENIVQAMNDLGISEQNIAKYLALGFNVIDGEKEKRVEVEKRCKTLENYYLEKLELTKNSNNRDNAAGFFIKALKGDWVSSKEQKSTKSKEAAQKRKEVEKRLKLLSVNVEKLKAQKETTKAPIIAKLLSDEVILKAAYDKVLSELGDFMKNHYADILHLPIKEQYEKGVGISSGINLYLMNHYPEKFTALETLDNQIAKAQKEMKSIKKKHPSIK